ncbi:MAG: cytochrome c-type biogenesis protein CcmH [Gammaproteobacteria bacterium]|nr:cytochrome c-type biogenesis protein CcmH [Gammaproteobacteria bacterium]
MKPYTFLLFVVFSFIQSSAVIADIEANEFASAEQEQQYNKLVNELRCLVCQNQNLSGSNSELAQDLRKEVYSMIQTGDTDAEIIEFMVARYGDFVLYNPPFKAITFLLWVGPFAVLILAVLLIVIFIRKNNNISSIELDSSEADKVADLLSRDSSKGNH